MGRTPVSDLFSVANGTAPRLLVFIAAGSAIAATASLTAVALLIRVYLCVRRREARDDFRDRRDAEAIAAIRRATARTARRCEMVRQTLAIAMTGQGRQLDVLAREETLAAIVHDIDGERRMIASLAQAVDETAKVGHGTYTLVNSASSALLKSLAVALDRVATLTGSEVDRAAAVDAERAYQAHEAQQRIVDGKGEYPPAPGED
jgi:hypothetical protein